MEKLRRLQALGHTCYMKGRENMRGHRRQVEKLRRLQALGHTCYMKGRENMRGHRRQVEKLRRLQALGHTCYMKAVRTCVVTGGRWRSREGCRHWSHLSWELAHYLLVVTTGSHLLHEGP